MSAVESCTRTSTLSGTEVPNSRSTARGSRTARARYSRLLYQEGGKPKDRARIAGAERADDDVVHLRRVLDDDEMERSHVVAEFLDRGGAVGEQALLVGGIGPGAGDDLRAHRGRDRVAKLDRLADVLGGEHALLDQELLEREPEELVIGVDLFVRGRKRVLRQGREIVRVRMRVAMIVIVIVVMMVMILRVVRHFAFHQIRDSQCS